jgi:hypothetical protein
MQCGAARCGQSSLHWPLKLDDVADWTFSVDRGTTLDNAISMSFFSQFWLENRMDIALSTSSAG